MQFAVKAFIRVRLILRKQWRLAMVDIEKYFKKADLLPAIIQEESTGEVLMLAYMNRD